MASSLSELYESARKTNSLCCWRDGEVIYELLNISISIPGMPASRSLLCPQGEHSTPSWLDIEVDD